MKNNNFVEFELSGGYFKTSHLRDKYGKKLFVDAESARKAGIPDVEKSDRIVRWNNGTPVGVVELSEKKNRVLKVPIEEKAFIEALCFHEFVDSEVSKSSVPKLTMRDLSKIDTDKYVKREKRKIVDTILVNMSNKDIEALAVVLGYPVDDAEDKIFALKDSNPDLFLSYFKEPFKKGNTWSAQLKEETIVGSVLKSAILKKVVTVKSGSILFEEEMIGTDFNKAVTNLMDTTKQGKANVFSLIKSKLETV